MHFVETSPLLRVKQAQALHCPESVIHTLHRVMESNDDSSHDLLAQGFQLNSHTKVHWHRNIDDLPGQGKLNPNAIKTFHYTTIILRFDINSRVLIYFLFIFHFRPFFFCCSRVFGRITN